MCRIAAYMGPPRSLEELFFAPEHNMLVQSRNPKEMKTATLNADGFGMAWYSDARAEPALYRTASPLWADENLPRITPHIQAKAALCNVRSATIGMGVQTSNVSPFVHGRWAFTHNGFLRDFELDLARDMRSALDDESYRAIRGTTDSEHIFALVLTHLNGLAEDEDPTRRFRRALSAIDRWIKDRRKLALLNIVLTDGKWLLATRYSCCGEAPSLYRRSGKECLFVASEPFDPGPAETTGWQQVPENTLLVMNPDHKLRIESLG